MSSHTLTSISVVIRLWTGDLHHVIVHEDVAANNLINSVSTGK